MIDTSSSKLLLVQNEPVLADLTQFRLELLGYQIEMARSGAEATAAISQNAYHLAIVDTALPDLDGIEWIAQTRSAMTADQLPIIVFSLDPSLETVERAFHAGATDYLITPFDPNVMEEKIEAILVNQQTAVGH